MKISNNLRATVKFSEEDFERIRLDAFTKKKSVPQLLRDAYFSRLPTKVLFNPDTERQLFTELKRIGNNINQIAKHLNSGESVGKSEFEQLNTQFTVISNYIRGVSGNS